MAGNERDENISIELGWMGEDYWAANAGRIRFGFGFGFDFVRWSLKARREVNLVQPTI